MSQKSKKNQKYALLVAGGSGLRMQSDIPKQFMELCGLPVLMHTIRLFRSYDADIPILVVLPALQISQWEQLCSHYCFSTPHQIVAGGETRFHSVKNGLATLPAEGWVAIHDGVRPLTSHATISACFRDAERYGNAIPSISVVDTVRETTGDNSHALNRYRLRLIQTPQVFDLALIQEAYRQDFFPEFTDDASVLEKAGHIIHLTEGNRENIKITTPLDMKVAEAVMTRQENYFLNNCAI
ncbi:MAG: 2-C-methyl-D-erythritol 4-phosphate cytidylyltransferase [Bacteroidales bacterium]|nr:2-C-methyl-D-erythritol 4-phosphate cytidylyltransferase [Bacteroidales bacterium]